MAPLVLEGENLGQKHRHFNSLVKQTIADQTTLEPINYDDADINNLLKIDVACSTRNVGYVLQVLTSEDMLYVSRAIKRSTWLITDDQYAHIINPKYLKDELFPKMTSKAKSKCILNLRLHLRDAPRVEAFYKAFANDINVAQKWLPYCSFEFIQNIIEKHAQDIEAQTLKRLCEISVNHFKIYAKASSIWLKSGRYIYRKDHWKTTMFLLNDYTDEYLDVVEALDESEVPEFGRRATEIIMRKSHDRVVNNFGKYVSCIDLPTYAKHMKKDALQDFLLQQAHIEVKNWVNFEKFKHFVKYLPIDTRFEFIKKLFIDKELPPTVTPGCDNVWKEDYHNYVPIASNARIYRWYQFASFGIAFTDLKKLIRLESNPSERNAMLMVLLHCTRRNPQHIQTILQYYHKKHIHEPSECKIQFVNTFVSLTETHKFHEKCWNILNNIFTSIGVYKKSENSVPSCIKAIIVYKLLHNQDIPEIIETKHAFDTFKDYRKKLDENEQNTLFTYLYDLELKKLNVNISSETEMMTTIETIKHILALVKDWERKVDDYPKIYETIKSLIKLKKEESWKTDLSEFYYAHKVLRRHLFEESVALHPTDQVCLNALKHDPGLLDRYDKEVAAMSANDAISLKNVLCKLRIYWAQSLALKWADAYQEQLSKPSGHKATIDGLCTLLPRTQCFNALAKYAPAETKINWSDTDEVLLSIRKNIAKRMRFVRPSPTLEAVLIYAKEDYLQYALPSLNAILYNMSPADTSQCIERLVNMPVSLQKHGIRLAFTKLQLSEIKKLIQNKWNSSTNSSIKAVIFKETYDLLCKEKEESNIKEIWELLSNFIDKLTQEENRIIYVTLGKVREVPLTVRPQCFEKSYLYLESLPTNCNCESIFKAIEYDAVDIVEFIDPAFVEDVLLKSTTEFMTDYYLNIKPILPIMLSYIVTAKDEESQYQRYAKLLRPILNRFFKLWGLKKQDVHLSRKNCEILLDKLLNSFKVHTLTSIVSVKIFKDIQKAIVTALVPEENYAILSSWNICVLFVESVTRYLMESEEKPSQWEEVCSKIATPFGEACLNFLKTDTSCKLYLSIHTIIARSLCDVLLTAGFKGTHILETFKPMLADSDVTVSYLVVLEVLCSTINRHDTIYDTNNIKDLKRTILNIIKLHYSTEIKNKYYEFIHCKSIRVYKL